MSSGSSGAASPEALAVDELLACEIEREPGREPVPGVTVDAPAVAQDVRDEDLAAEELTDEQRGDRALAPGGFCSDQSSGSSEVSRPHAARIALCVSSSVAARTEAGGAACSSSVRTAAPLFARTKPPLR